MRYLCVGLTKFEDKVLVEEALIFPEDPAEAGVDQTELVAGGVDGDDTRDLEVPDVVGRREGCDERAGSTVDVDRDRVACCLLIFVEQLGHFSDWLVVAGVSTCNNVRDWASSTE